MGDMYFSSPSTNFFAIIRFAASLGWYGSQNTCFVRSSHRLETGPQGIIPANWPPLPQQAALEVVNPGDKKKSWKKHFVIFPTDMISYQTKIFVSKKYHHLQQNLTIHIVLCMHITYVSQDQWGGLSTSLLGLLFTWKAI